MMKATLQDLVSILCPDEAALVPNKVITLCDWWNARNPGRIGRANHFGVYISIGNLLRSGLAEDPSIRNPEDFRLNTGTVEFGPLFLEFRYMVTDGLVISSYDMSGRTVECHRGTPDLFPVWSELALSAALRKTASGLLSEFNEAT
jgi:hypothetical protein